MRLAEDWWGCGYQTMPILILVSAILPRNRPYGWVSVSHSQYRAQVLPQEIIFQDFTWIIMCVFFLFFFRGIGIVLREGLQKGYKKSRIRETLNLSTCWIVAPIPKKSNTFWRQNVSPGNNANQRFNCRSPDFKSYQSNKKSG